MEKVSFIKCLRSNNLLLKDPSMQCGFIRNKHIHIHVTACLRACVRACVRA
jgi:hypothetical protein